MATGMVLSVTQTLLSALQYKNELKELCTMFGYKSQLDELKSTVSTIQAVLLDAESKHQELTNQGLDWIEKLKDAVYDVDDLVDELNTVAHLWKRNKGAKFTQKVQQFFSRYNKWFVAFNASNDLKKMRLKLDSIARDRTQFGFGDLYEPIKSIQEETGAYVYEQSIIGRDSDRDAIVNLLLQDSGFPVSYITIVGIGGLGKTALAQIVYSDDRVQGAFDLMLWVCVSDEFKMEKILTKMLMSATQECCNDLTMDQLYNKVTEYVIGKKYLLVLDDVWEEQRQEWLKLMHFLVQGERGSRIMVTTRSTGVANAMGDYPVYELQGLSKEHSWGLFKAMAFREVDNEIDSDLVDIGKRLVERCANVPIAIRVVGSLLYGQGKKKWLSVESADEILGKDKVTKILKFSYYHLSPCLKSCFSNCALFPKDFVIKKQLLISLWMAHGCLDEPDSGRSPEDVGEDCFMFLLQRCFFQDAKRDDEGEITSVKLHDLIHDLAQEIAGKEYLCVRQEFGTSNDHKKIRHSSLYIEDLTLHLRSSSKGNMKELRTYLWLPSEIWKVEKDLTKILFANYRKVRFLYLRKTACVSKSLGNLLHLRHLDLSSNGTLQVLPKSITKLHNLTELRVRGCSSLEELPKNLRVLVNLRVLDITDCNGLNHMPAGIDNLTNLHTLPMYVVGCKRPQKTEIGQLEDLRGLINLKGKLVIKLKQGCLYDLDEANLLRELHLKSLRIVWEEAKLWKGTQQETSSSLEGLEPNCDLRELDIERYKGAKLPTWAMEIERSLQCLTKITLCDFNLCEHLSSLSQLLQLKYLKLARMDELTFVEGKSGGVQLTFFPSLVELSLSNMLKLKNWWDHDDAAAVIPSFPRLQNLVIGECPRLTSFPSFPQLKTIHVRKLNEGMRLIGEGDVPTSNLANMSLEEIHIDHTGLLNSLTERHLLRCIRLLRISKSEEESLSTTAEAFERCSLVSLELVACWNLKTLCGSGMEHLINLECLKIKDCVNLNFEDGMMTMQLWKSLSSLYLTDLPQLINLPTGIQHLTNLAFLEISCCGGLESIEGIQCLTSLDTLCIEYCYELKSLPQAMQYLTSLQTLELLYCEGLKERVMEPDGEDWCIIKDIPCRDFKY